MIKILKFTSIIILSIATIILLALYWPLAEIRVPSKSKNILIKSISIIDVKSGKVLKDRNVWIEGNRIKSIDSLEITVKDPSVLIINGKDQYIIPGLWDMHTHSTQLSPWLHQPLYIANGVLSIRDMSGQLGRADSYWAGTKDRLSWNQKLSNFSQITPRYVQQSSYQINGDNSVPSGFPSFFKVSTADDVKSLLAYYQNEGADFIKVYADIPADAYRTLAKHCSKYNLHLAGHKPLSIKLNEAIEKGQRSFEHGRIFMFDCFPYADSLLKAMNKAKVFYDLKPSMITHFDSLDAIVHMELMKTHNAHWTPTLQTVKMSAFADQEAFIQNPHLEYIPSLRKALFWNPDIKRAARSNVSVERKGVNMAFYQSVKKQIQMANQLEVPIMVGTDVTDTYVFPGFSVHTEMQDLVAAGLSNLEALRAATHTPALYCGRENESGSIAEGKFADLVLLTKNPLEDIAHTRAIKGVILNGNYYDENTLMELKKTTKSMAASFHMNVKFMFSLLSSPLMRKQIAD